MKIAILFSGRLRELKKSYDNIMKNVVQSNDVDFFLSHEKNTNENDLNGFIDIFKPKKIFRSDENYFNVEHYPHPTNVGVKSRHNLMCMYLNRYYVQKIFDEYCTESGEKYDIIFSYRVDFIIGSPLNYDELLDKIKDDYVCIPQGHDHNGINDRMAFGNYKVMKKYLNCYEKLYEMFENGETIHAETILGRYLYLNNFKIYRVIIGYGFI